jgi:hypothetical protein
MKLFTVLSLSFLSLTGLMRSGHAGAEGNCLGATPENDLFCQKLEENACYNDPICNWVPSDETESKGSNS